MKKNKKLWGRHFVIVILVGAMMFTSVNAVCADIQDQLDELEKEIENSQDNAEAQQELADLLSEQLEELDQKINDTTALIDQYSEEKIQVEADLAEATEELEEATADRNYYQKLLEDRLAVMYMYGDSGYLDVLFGATSFSDFISRVEVVSSIISYDHTILDKLEETEETIEAKKQEIEEKNAELETLIANLSDQEDQLEDERQQKDDKMAEIEDNIIYWNALAEEQEEEAEDLRRIIAATNSTGDYGNDFDSLFLWPVPGHYTITDYFGYRIHPITGVWKMHNGIDIGASRGSEIVAPANGKVTYAGYKTGYGNTVIIDIGTTDDGDKLSMLFAHASKLLVSEGDIVTEGEVIALVGSTGNSTGPHLHFGVALNGEWVDPLNYVSNSH